MDKQKKYKLINGTFSADESKEILTSVFSGKIQFHQLKNLSSLERFGKEDPFSIHRLAELNTDMTALISYLNEAKSHGKQLKIESYIEINLL